MATSKRFYWIKLKEAFMNGDEVDYLMSQKDGANYIVLYQMLCLKTMNTNGELARQIGEVLIPYDAEKIARDCKYFSVDTVRVALEAYKSLGMIYEQNNGILKITNFSELTGSNTDYAEQKAIQRANKTNLLGYGQGVDNVHTDIDIDIRYRDREEEKEKDIEKDSSSANAETTKKVHKKFIPPTEEEVKSYCKSVGSKVDAEAFVAFYESKGWKIGKEPMVSWKSAIVTWEKRNNLKREKKVSETPKVVETVSTEKPIDYLAEWESGRIKL